MAGNRSTAIMDIRAEAGQMLGVMREMVSEEQKMRRSAGRSAKAHQNSLGKLLDFNKVLRSSFFGITSALSVGAVMGGARAFEQRMRSLNQLNDEFEKDVTPLLSLGDNLNNIWASKDRVLEYSIAMNRTRKEVADFFFALESGTAGIEDKREEFAKLATSMSRLTGISPEAAVKGPLKLFRVFEEGAIKSVRAAGDMILKTQELADITQEQLNILSPEPLSAAAALGIPPEQVLAAITVATPRLGRSERALTGVKTAILSILDAEEKLKTKLPTDDLIESLKILEPLLEGNAKKFEDLVGREGLSAMQAMISNIDQMISQSKVIAALNVPDEPGTRGLVESKEFRKNVDPAFRASDLSGKLTKAIEAEKISSTSKGGFARDSEIIQKLVDLDFQRRLGPTLADSFIVSGMKKVAGLGATLNLKKNAFPGSFTSFPRSAFGFLGKKSAIRGADVLLEQQGADRATVLQAIEMRDRLDPNVPGDAARRKAQALTEREIADEEAERSRQARIEKLRDRVLRRDFQPTFNDPTGALQFNSAVSELESLRAGPVRGSAPPSEGAATGAQEVVGKLDEILQVVERFAAPQMLETFRRMSTNAGQLRGPVTAAAAEVALTGG